MAVSHKAPESKYTLEGIIRYITDQSRHDERVIYYAGIGTQPYYAIRDMLITKQLFSKTDRSQYKHIILLMGQDTDESNFITATDEIAKAFYNLTGCQLVYAIHANTEKLHMHMVINSIRYNDGTRLDINNRMYFTMINICNCILNRYGLEKVKTAERFIREDYGEDIYMYCN